MSLEFLTSLLAFQNSCSISRIKKSVPTPLSEIGYSGGFFIVAAPRHNQVGLIS